MGATKRLGLGLWVCALGVGLVGCAGKEPLVDVELGAEDAVEAKADSVTRPSTLVPIALDRVTRTTLTTAARFRGFVFSGRAGQRFDLFADGLSGLDTVLYVYKVSPTTGRAYGRSLASNDDTSKATWTLLSNAAPNELSSSVSRFSLPSAGSYALVVSSYGQGGVGDVEVRVRPYSTKCDASAAARRFTFPGGVTDPESVGLELESEAVAERYADPLSRSVTWLVKEGEDTRTQRWVWGRNDLWAVRFNVDRTSCAVSVTGEH